MIKLIFFTSFLFILSCDKQKAKVAEDIKSNGKAINQIKQSENHAVYDTVNHFKKLPMASSDSIDVIIGKRLLGQETGLDRFSLENSSIVANRYNIFVTNILFSPKLVRSGMEFSPKGNRFTVTELNYSSKGDVQNTLVKLKEQINISSNQTETFGSYFKPCGFYVLTKNSKIILVRNNYCSDTERIENFIVNNKIGFDNALYISAVYDSQKNREMIVFKVLK